MVFKCQTTLICRVTRLTAAMSDSTSALLCPLNIVDVQQDVGVLNVAVQKHHISLSTPQQHVVSSEKEKVPLLRQFARSL